MTVDQFFDELLKSQELTKDQIAELEDHRDEVEAILREEFGSEPTIRFAGSRAKGTMIADSYDLDIACYFPNDCGMTIKEVYYKAKEILDKKYTIDPKTSAIRIKNLKGDETPVDYHIDVVPGRFIDDGKDVFLYLSSAEGNYIQTNLKTHIAHIKDGGQQDVIKLMKLWKVRNRLTLRTFVLELLVVRVLKDSKITRNPRKVREVLVFIRDQISDVRLEDPANSANVVSELLTPTEKIFASSLAGEAIRILDSAQNEGAEVEAWRKVFKEEAGETHNTVSTPLVIRREPPKPWCNV